MSRGEERRKGQMSERGRGSEIRKGQRDDAEKITKRRY